MTVKLQNRVQPIPPRTRDVVCRYALWVLAVAFMVIIMLTLCKAFMDVPGLINGPAHRIRRVNLEPFAEFHYSTTWWGPWTNFFGNIALFVPLGFAAAVLWRRRAVEIFFLAFCLSCGIELTQYVLRVGFTDIDDVTTNTAGAVAGILLVRLRHDQQVRLLQMMGLLLTVTLIACLGGLMLGRAHGMWS